LGILWIFLRRYGKKGNIFNVHKNIDAVRPLYVGEEMIAPLTANPKTAAKIETHR